MRQQITIYIISAVIISLLVLILFEVRSGYNHSSSTSDSEVRYIPTPRETVQIPAPAIIDTQRVINNYYHKLVYRDTIVKKDIATVTLTDTIYQNAIAGRTVDVSFRPTYRIKNNAIGLLSVAGSRQLLLMGAYRYKRLLLYGGYDLVQMAPVAGIGYQLFNW